MIECVRNFGAACLHLANGLLQPLYGLLSLQVSLLSFKPVFEVLRRFLEPHDPIFIFLKQSIAYHI